MIMIVFSQFIQDNFRFLKRKKSTILIVLLLGCNDPLAFQQTNEKYEHDKPLLRWHFVTLQWCSTSPSEKAHDPRTELYLQ